MNENIKWIAAAVAVVGLSIGAVVYFSMRGEPSDAASRTCRRRAAATSRTRRAGRQASAPGARGAGAAPAAQ